MAEVTVWILLLRGINVGGNGKLPMAELRAIIEAEGAAAVSTYIQSGNAVFRSDRTRADLANAITERIEAARGFRPDLFLLTQGEMEAALAGNPWPEAEGDAKPMHLFFHDGSAKPDSAALDELLAEDEAWAVTPEVLYLRAPSGVGRSKFAERLPRLFRARMTARNLNTCRKLVQMAADAAT